MQQGQMLRDGPKSTVYRGPDPGTVTKVYHSTQTRDARDAAEAEWNRLHRLHRQLMNVDGVSCPRPIRWGEIDRRWYLSMEEAHGDGLLTIARSSDRPDPCHVGSLIARAIVVHGDVFDEPHYSIKPEDVLIDRVTGDVIILDFEPSHVEVDLAGMDTWAAPPAASSAALFSGRTFHHAAAPHMFVRRSSRRWLVDVAVHTLRNVDRSRTHEATAVIHAVYRMLYTRRRTARWRPLWYRLRWFAVGRPALRRALSEP